MYDKSSHRHTTKEEQKWIIENVPIPKITSVEVDGRVYKSIDNYYNYKTNKEITVFISIIIVLYIIMFVAILVVLIMN